MASRQASLTDFMKSTQKRSLADVEGKDQENKSKTTTPSKPKITSKSNTAKKSPKPLKQSQEQAKDFQEEEKVQKQTTTTTVSVSVSDQQPDQQDNILNSLEDFKASLGNWRGPLSHFIDKPLFEKLYNYVKAQYAQTKCFPPQNMIFNAFSRATFDKVNVVIVGQDPYIKDNEAMGLCFSIPKGIKVPPSLKNIYLALEADKRCNFKMPAPIHGDLTSWADQGVFLLNCVLTVQAGKSNSHQKQGWEQFSDAAIDEINKNCNNVVFLLWGKTAQLKAKSVNKSKHLVLEGVHPSPLAGTAFKTCTHFGDANDYLLKNGREAINWNSL